MNRQKTPLAIALLLLATLACQSILPTEAPTPTLLPVQPQGNSVLQSEDQVPRIGVKEAKTAVDSGQAVLIDVRAAESYAERHAVGAISIPLDIFEFSIDSLTLEKSQWIITYCT